MIELIQDKGDKEAMIYTDEASTARELRKALKQAGAYYSCKGGGYSWRAPRKTIKDFLDSRKLENVTLVSR